MKDSLSVEMTGPLFVIGHVVAMSEEHQPYAAELLDALDQRGRKARRVYEHVSFGTDDQIA